ncbi:MAG: RNA degradosome polyphosphate kinase, partial [Thermoanaerobaculia bacterium]
MSEPERTTVHPFPELAPAAAEETAPYLNRELSWLEFNRRVLAEAEDPDNPPLERLKFVAIFDGNLDDFFMKRVGGLRQQLASNLRELPPDGASPREQLGAINLLVRPMMARQRQLLHGDLLPALAEHGLEVARWEELRPGERRHLSE